MARDSSRSQKAAADSQPIDSGAALVAASTGTSVSSASLQHDAAKMKEILTAPFMIYDPQIRRIVPNPSYNRTVLTEVRRLQSIALTKLRTPMQANMSYTPKELLYELEAALFCICASAAVTSNSDALRYFMSDAEADAAMPQLESFLAHHNAPAKATVSLAYCLTEGTSHAVLTSFISMLQQRVEEALDPAIDRKRTEEERRALRATKNNINDIAQLLRDVETTYHTIDTPSQVQRRQPQSDPTQVDVARSPAANAVPAQMIDEAFYKVLRWVMAVDTDRRALKIAALVASGRGSSVDEQLKGTSAAATAMASAMSATDSMKAAAAAATAMGTPGFAKVVDYDPFTGQATLERVGESQRWGLLLNAKGLLVGLENELRNSSEAGERLYDTVQQQSGEVGGLAIYEVNRRRIRPVHMTDDALEESRSDILLKLQKGLTQPTKTLHLSIEKRKQADLTSPQEVLYEVSYQGGENCVGQRCLLMLERASTTISWGLKLKYVKGSPAVLSDFSPNVRLSAAAKNFLFDVRGRVRVLQMNSRDVSQLTAAEVKELVSKALILTLNLQVTDAHGEVPEEAVNATEKEEPQQVTAEVEAAPAAVEEGEREMWGNSGAVEGSEVDPVEAGEALAVETATAVPSVEQAELDDVAAAIADEFLLQKELTNDAADEHEAEAEAVVATEASKPLPEVENDAVGDGDAFEELEWAKPTSSFGAPGGEEENHNGYEAEATAQLSNADEEDHTAQLEEEGDEHAAERALLKKFHLLPERGPRGKGRVEAVEEVEAEEQPLAEGEKLAGLEGEDTAELDAGLGDGAADEDAKVLEPSASAKNARRGRRVADELENGQRKKKKAQEKKTRGRKKAAAPKKGKTAHATAAAAPEEQSAVQEGVSLASTELDEAPQDETGSGRRAVEAPKEKRSGNRAVSTAAIAEAEDMEETPEVFESKDEAVGDDGTDGVAAVQAAADVPLVHLPPTAAEVAMEEGRKNAAKEKRGRKSKAKEVAAEEEAGAHRGTEEMSELREHAEAGKEPEASSDNMNSAKPVADYDTSSPSRVSLSELMSASPLTFENDVKLEKFDGSTLELERASVTSPWNIKVAFAGDDIIMTKLPPIPKAQLQHPFLRSLGAGAQGEVKWVVERLNGQDLSLMSKTLKTKALDAIKGATQLSFVLKALRK
ncbi:hypothetical protein ABL78_6138 [Leptomonas seymouri]|uniref:Uncharacterized protein n=1 Tax=Leptomonas seymouri TaxID=5684 RepID=A0A0N1HU54_LEPSE|nr:hypothetical protein ABL78_6138 [Leptomonas seymouri]|eukprot:KPI84810.1 hypothetical protein ABL78_6138 [Leptomonas seymouri]